MKKILVIIFALFSFSAFAQSEITFMESEFDFGTIKEGEKVSHDFKFKNTGNAPLILSNVMISCDCTTSEWPKEPIMPGKEGTIKVMYDSKDKEGVQKRTLVILSNAANSTERISIVLNVLNPNPEN